MTTNDVFLDACKGLVMHCNCNILILNVLGEFRAYIAPEVRLKTRECRYNEVQDAQDITKLILNLGHNFAQGMNEQTLRENAQSIHKESFKFGRGRPISGGLFICVFVQAFGDAFEFTQVTVHFLYYITFS